MPTLRVKHKKLLDEEYDKTYYLGYLTSYARRDHVKGWDVHKIYEGIACMDFPHSQHQFDRKSDLEAEQENFIPENDPALGARRDSSTTSKGKEVMKEN